MKKNDNAVFKQAFDELEKEGYFNEISAKIKYPRSASAVAGSKPPAYTTKKTPASRTKKTKINLNKKSRTVKV